MATKRKPSPAGLDSQASLESFFQTVRYSNPFRSNRVSNVSLPISDEEGRTEPDDFIDVPTIHGKPYRRLQRVVRAVRDNGECLGVSLTGAAGVGKSHLLSRLCRWLEGENNGYFVFLHNVMVSAEQMPRHMLKSVVSVLAEGRLSYRDSALYRLVHNALKKVCRTHHLNSREVDEQQLRRAFNATLRQQLPSQGHLHSQVLDLLFHFFAQVNRHPTLNGETRDMVDAMVDWLSGDSISQEAANRIGVSIPEAKDEEEETLRLPDDQHIATVFSSLCTLAGMSDRVLMICLDQFDNLHADQVTALSNFLLGLFGHCRHLVMITSGITQTIQHFVESGTIPRAAWDRMGQTELALPQCTQREVSEMLIMRLENFRSKFEAVAELRPYFEREVLFPIAEKDFLERFESMVEIRPRIVLSWASDAWEQQQDLLDDLGETEWLRTWDCVPGETPSERGKKSGQTTEPKRGKEEVVPRPPIDLPAAIDKVVRDAITEGIADRREQSGNLPPDADNLTTLTERLLNVCTGREEYSLTKLKRSVPAKGKNVPYHLEVEERIAGKSTKALSGVAFVTTRNGASAFHALNRLLKVAKKLQHRILVTDEERAPLPQSTKCAEKYRELLALGTLQFRHIKLSFQQYVELDSLRSVMDEAGDLVVESAPGEFRPLTREEVIESLHRQRRLLKHPLLEELLCEPNAPSEPPPPPLPEDLIADTIRGHLAWRFSITTNAITEELLREECYRDFAFETLHSKVVGVSQRLALASEIEVREHRNGLLLMHAR
ncbi:MAG: ATP-binding protein [Planctomycetaceae bacterium]|nr:ATP-binding protein [Planctomycetaceae bacterium]